MVRLEVSDLLARASAARGAGDREAAARLYDEEADERRAVGDVEGWAEAVLGAASLYVFGAEPGKLPAQLHEVLEQAADQATRARLASALARCWVYSGHQDRGLPFAEQALHDAEQVGSPELIADSLDAALAVNWGPDQLETRRLLAVRLDAVAAHLLDPEARLTAHLWGLQVACDLMDMHSVRRHLRALELLGRESPKALFFAATRRLMLDLLQGRTDTAFELLRTAEGAGQQAGLADAWMVLAGQRAYVAAQSGDSTTCAEVAEAAESFSLSEGAAAVCAEAAFMWASAGRVDRAAALVTTFRGAVLDELPKDVNWLLTLQCTLEAALTVGDREVIATASRLLGPFAGRAVFNAGAIMFHGVTDDTLARAAGKLGDQEAAARLRAGALASYEQLGATWWRDRMAASPKPGEGERASAVLTAHLEPIGGGLWLVGTGQSPAPVRALRGFGYLAELLRRPHQAIAAPELAGGGTGVLVEAGLGEVIDRRALAAYRHRLLEVESELQEAEDWADTGRVSALASERDALLDEVAAATGLGGRLRFTGSSAERARVAVQKAITAAISRIATVDVSLASHLRSSIRTGQLCSYDPDTPTPYTWVLASR